MVSGLMAGWLGSHNPVWAPSVSLVKPEENWRFKISAFLEPSQHNWPFPLSADTPRLSYPWECIYRQKALSFIGKAKVRNVIYVWPFCSSNFIEFRTKMWRQHLPSSWGRRTRQPHAPPAAIRLHVGSPIASGRKVDSTIIRTNICMYTHV